MVVSLVGCQEIKEAFNEIVDDVISEVESTFHGDAKKVNVKIFKEKVDDDTGEVVMGEMIMDVDFPMTVSDVRELINTIPQNKSLSWENICNYIIENFSGLKSTKYTHPFTSPCFYFPENEYDDYEWKYGTPSSAYCNLLEISSDMDYCVSINDMQLIKMDKRGFESLVSLDEMVSIYGKYETVKLHDISFNYYKITDDVYMFFRPGEGRIRLVYPYLDNAPEGESSINKCGRSYDERSKDERLESYAYEMKVGKRIQINALGKKYKSTYTITDDSVIYVEDDYIVGKNRGTSIITVYDEQGTEIYSQMYKVK